MGEMLEREMRTAKKLKKPKPFLVKDDPALVGHSLFKFVGKPVLVVAQKQNGDGQQCFFKPARKYRGVIVPIKGQDEVHVIMDRFLKEEPPRA